MDCLKCNKNKANILCDNCKYKCNKCNIIHCGNKKFCNKCIKIDYDIAYNSMTCNECNKKKSIEDIVKENNNKYYCIKCINNLLYICKKCKINYKDIINNGNKRKYYCINCSICTRCSINKFKNGICKNCNFLCSNCDKIYNKHKLHILENNLICEKCI